MEFIPPSEHLCYVRCNFCNTVLAVGIPCKRVLDTVTVKCGHCSSLSFLATKQQEPPFQAPQCLDLQMMSGFQGFSHDQPKAQPFSASSSSSVIKATPMAPKESHVIKPPERKHRIPSAYNRFMKEEIQWIKTANPQIPHREAFSAAARNWARYIPHSQPARSSEMNQNERCESSAIESLLKD